MPNKDNENTLIQNLIRGDASSFDGIYKQYYNKVYSFSYRYLQNTQDAEGVVQEVFISLWNNRDKLREVRNLNAWLFTVTFNQIRKIFRNMAIEKRKMKTYAMSSLFDDSSTVSAIEFNDLMEKAEDIIERLPHRQKTVLLLNLKDGLSSNEISRKLKITKRTVENHLSSARAFLKKVFKKEHLIPLIIYWLLL